MKPIHNVVKNVPLLLLLIQVLATSSTATSLRISKSSAPGMAFELDAQGNVSTKLVKQTNTAPQLVGSFLAKKGTVNKFVLDNTNYYVAATAYSGDVARTAGDLVVGSSSVAAAKITAAGDLVIKGKFPGFSKTSSVAYVGGATFTTTASSNGTMVFAYENIGGDGKTIYTQSGTPDKNYFYIKDHLGSTRLVLSDAGAVSDYVDYKPYGAIVDLTPSGIEPEQAREKFTGKEFDNDGEVNGTGGIDAYYFIARYYDPEVGIFLSTDPKAQYANAYSYVGGNPILLVDPNGENAVGAIIGAVIGAYAGGAMANGSFNPGDWNWEDPGTWLGMLQGGISGASMGSSIENSIAVSNFEGGNIPKSAYGASSVISGKGGPSAIKQSYLEKTSEFWGRGNHTLLADGGVSVELQNYLKVGGEIWVIETNESGMKVLTRLKGYVETDILNFEGSPAIMIGDDVGNRVLPKSFYQNLMDDIKKLGPAGNVPMRTPTRGSIRG